MATGTIVSLEEYLSTIYDPDCEYLDGELIERNMGESDHSAVQGIICAILYGLRREFGIHIFPELRVQISPRRFRIPDISVTTQKVRTRVLREPPFLCMVLSPEDRASRVESKIDEYLAFGVPYVWVIDPEERKAWCYTNEKRREPSAVLTTSNPRLTLSLEELFAAVDEDVEV